MLVPLRYMYALSPMPATWTDGYIAGRRAPSACSETILMPGARRSGFTTRSYIDGPRELDIATVSSDRSTVPHVLSAPTVIAYGELPGDVMPPMAGRPLGVFPLLPAAATTTIPACTAWLTAWHSGSVAQASSTG